MKEDSINQFKKMRAFISGGQCRIDLPLPSNIGKKAGKLVMVFLGKENTLFNLIEIHSTEIPEYIANPVKGKKELKINYCAAGRCELTLKSGECTYLTAGEIAIDTGQAENSFYYPSGEYIGYEVIVSIDGKIYTRKNLTKNCYMVMQDVNHQLFTDSVITEVMLSMEHPDEKKAEKILASLDLLQYKDKHPMALSGGQKQRVAIASAMAADAVMLLFDEPTSGLDYRHMKEVSALLKGLAKERKTIFVATHDPELVAECCDRTIQIIDGYARQIK